MIDRDGGVVVLGELPEFDPARPFVPRLTLTAAYGRSKFVISQYGAPVASLGEAITCASDDATSARLTVIWTEVVERFGRARTETRLAWARTR